MLAWAIAGVVCTIILVHAANTVGTLLLRNHDYLEWISWGPGGLHPSRPGALSLLSALSPLGTPLITFCVGAVAGLRWPDGLLVPFRTSRIPRNLRITANFVLIFLVAFPIEFLLTFHPFWIPLLYDGALFWTWQIGRVVVDLLVISLAMLLAQRSLRSTPQLRNVILGGGFGVILMVILGVLVVGLMQEADNVLLQDELEDGFIYWLPIIFKRGIPFFLWLGLALGIWAGLRWPNRLWLPGDSPEGPPALGLGKSLIAMGFYAVSALTFYLVVSFAVVSFAYR